MNLESCQDLHDLFELTSSNCLRLNARFGRPGGRRIILSETGPSCREYRELLLRLLRCEVALDWRLTGESNRGGRPLVPSDESILF